MKKKQIILIRAVTLFFFCLPLSFSVAGDGDWPVSLNTVWVLPQAEDESVKMLDFFADRSFSEWQRDMGGMRTLRYGVDGPPEEYVQYWFCADPDGNFAFFYQLFSSGMLSDKAIVKGAFDFEKMTATISKRNKPSRPVTDVRLSLYDGSLARDRPVPRLSVEINRVAPPIQEFTGQETLTPLFCSSWEIHLPPPVSGSPRTGALLCHTVETNLTLRLPISECSCDGATDSACSFQLDPVFRMQYCSSPSQDGLDFVSILPAQPFTHVFSDGVTVAKRNGTERYNPFSAVWINTEWSPFPPGMLSPDKVKSSGGVITFMVRFRGTREDIPLAMVDTPLYGHIELYLE